MSQVILQEAVSRSLSLRHDFSNLSWSRGLTNFYEGVPFSYCTSLKFIKQITKLLINFCEKNTSQNMFHFYGLGSGTGMFMFSLIEYLSRDHPDVFKRFHFHISDFSNEIVDFYYKNSTYLKFKDVIECEVIDFSNLQFEGKPVPDIIFMSYLWDAVDTIHMEYKQNTLYEIKVKTYLDKTDGIIDTSSVYPKYLTAQDLQKICLDADQSRLKQLLPKLVPLLKEEYSYHQFDYSKVSKDEATLLQNHLERVVGTKNLKFNYSTKIFNAIQHIKQVLSKDGLIMVYDMGYEDITFKKGISGMTVPYELTVFYDIYFPLYHELFKQDGFESLLTSFSSGSSQFSLTSLGQTDNYKHTFKKEFYKDLSGSSGQNLSTIKKTINQSNAVQNTIAYVASLKETDYSYYFLTQAMIISYESDVYEVTKFIGDLFLKRFKNVPVVGLNLLAKTTYYSGDVLVSEQYLKKAIQFDPNFADLYLNLSLTLLKQNKFEELIECLERYFKLNSKSPRYMEYLNLIIAYVKCDRIEESKRLIEHIVTVENFVGNAFPKKLLEQLDVVLESIVI